MSFINGPSYVDVVLNIFRRFMNQKMASRVFVHGRNVESFHKIVPADILPEEYGGKKGKLVDLIEHWKRRVMEKRDWFLEDEKYKAQQ
ncbi:hypothetical protein J437_LFUL011347 [Ladona fulva]|uniref:CRAL-TRIO domain-containing protein n=1 Tax=Ladona fulva TaxID=123851 RepID=A0A8K0KAF3_LADFU|nr:hypothetical protein J437_LFUL011347 [Ladona fulva]